MKLIDALAGADELRMGDIAAGWYRDPGNPQRARRWDGDQWTSEVRPVAGEPARPAMAPTEPNPVVAPARVAVDAATGHGDASAGPAAPAGTTSGLPIPVAIALAGGILMLLGVFGPWLSIGIDGSVSQLAFERADFEFGDVDRSWSAMSGEPPWDLTNQLPYGLLIIPLAVIALAGALGRVAGTRLTAAGCGAAVGVLAVTFRSDLGMFTTLSDMSGGLMSIGAGWGVWACLLGSALMVGGALASDGRPRAVPFLER